MSDVEKRADPGGDVLPEDRLTAEEKAMLVALNRVLHTLYTSHDRTGHRQEAQGLYLHVKARVSSQTGRFGVVNNRIFRGDGELIVPYLVGDTLIVHRVKADGETETLTSWRFPSGTIITDERLFQLVGRSGEVIDLEKEIFDPDFEQAVEIRLTRLRDLGALLARVNQMTRRNEAVYALRFLVAQLCSPSFPGFLGAKNLQPEVRTLVHELKQFVNAPFAREIPILVRFLVRNVSGIVVKPGIIDQLWNDAVEINEVLVRGSDITAEIRRSAHHALGDRTLRLVRAYRSYLEQGHAGELERLGYANLSDADARARNDACVHDLLDRLEQNLEKLLGNTEVLAQLRDWQEEFRRALRECENGHTLREEGELALTQGLRAGNRFVFYHHLRAIQKKVDGFEPGVAAVDAIRSRLEAWLTLRPDQDSVDVAAVEAEMRGALDELENKLADAFETEIFADVEHALDAFLRRTHFEAATIIHRLRRRVAERLEAGGFPDYRYHLYQLDCLLEHMSYLALRHMATEYEEKGVRLRQCLEIIHGAIASLASDGVYSREVADLAGMLTDGNKTYGELSNVMEHLQRNYHKSIRWITSPFEIMQNRLGFDDVQLRMALANMQRYMHDHNSMVNFCDLARTYIRQHIAYHALRLSREPSPAVRPDETWNFLRLSDRAGIRRMVENLDVHPNPRERYGGKGSGLVYLSHLSIPTRDGFILPTSLPQAGLHNTDQPALRRALREHVTQLVAAIRERDGDDRALGDPVRPLLLAVRGGSVFSMPGILSTVVFVGMNDAVAATLAEDDPWYAYDAYRRFLASFAQAVWSLDLEDHDLVADAKKKYGVPYKNQLPWEAMKEISDRSLTILRDEGYAEELQRVLDDPWEQLFVAVRAVFNSWNRSRAQQYREIKGIGHTWQTACTVQQMASGNRCNFTVGSGMDESRASLTGVIPRTILTAWGGRRFTGEIKFSAIGDDLVGGVTTSKSFQTIEELEELMPMLHRRLHHIVAKIIRFMGVDQEVEFTVENGVLSVLQVRAAETGADQEGVPFRDPPPPVTRGLGIRGGAFRGLVVFDDADRRALARRVNRGGRQVDGVLVVIENPTPDDIPLILSADGLLTAKGGNTSHAAIAIHGVDDRNYSAVMSAARLRVFGRRHEAIITDTEGNAKHVIRRGDVVSIHGSDGDVYLGSQALFHEA
jgi:phosphohistidine swiveling domain-containing protein